jgi:LytR cell envelope-related transcriptional attenuator/TPR repeat
MKRAIVIAIDAALCAFLATGCATQKAPQPQIKPVLEVRHSGLQPDGYYQLGRFLQEQQRYDEAAVAYRKALALDPKHADSHNGLGTLLAEFTAALAQAPESPAVLNNIGYTFLLERKPVEAIAPLTRATELAPENPRYSSNLGIALNNQSPGPAEALATTAAPATFDAVPAPTQPASPAVISTADEADSVRLVSIGPNAFELVIPKPIASKAMVAVLPASQGRLGVEVSNGNGTSGMAKSVGQQLASAGVKVSRLTNQVPYGEFTTRVEYRPGHEQAALDLSWRVPGRPPVVASIALRKDIDVRLVLGRELPVGVALLAPAEQVAHYEAALPD